MKLYPVFLDMSGKSAIIIGGGEVALRKVKDLLEAEAKVKVISPQIIPELSEIVHAGRIILEKRKYTKGDLAGAILVFAATDSEDVNRQVFEEASENNILINAVDDPPNCSFYVPSFTRRGDLVLALSTGGASPAMAARLRRIIEKEIPDDIEYILAALSEARCILKKSDNYTSSERGALLKKTVNDDALLGKLVEAWKRGVLQEYLKK